MAHKKGQSTTSNGRESHSKRLGIKKFGNQTVISGNIIVRQRGTKMVAGIGTGLGKDHTVFATKAGVISFKTSKITDFTGKSTRHTVVSVL